MFLSIEVWCMTKCWPFISVVYEWMLDMICSVFWYASWNHDSSKGVNSLFFAKHDIFLVIVTNLSPFQECPWPLPLKLLNKYKSVHTACTNSYVLWPLPQFKSRCSWSCVFILAKHVNSQGIVQSNKLASPDF